MRSQALLVAILALCGCVGPAKDRPVVDLEKLLRDPANFDGLIVSVAGYISYGFEDCVLWVDRVAFENREVERAAWFWPKSATCFGIDSRRRQQDGSGIVTGSFDAAGKGHLGLFPASINDASFMYLETSNHRMERAREP